MPHTHFQALVGLNTPSAIKITQFDDFVRHINTRISFPDTTLTDYTIDLALLTDFLRRCGHPKISCDFFLLERFDGII